MIAIRPEEAILLDRLVECANDAAEAYGQAAPWCERDLARLFSSLSGQRRAQALAMEDQVRRLGHAPRDRDSVPGTAHRVLARLKASFTAERSRVLLEECERADSQLASHLAAARHLPPEPEALLRRIQAEVVAALGQLAAAKLRLRG